MRPFRWTELRNLGEYRGFEYNRHRGSHYVMTKNGVPRPVVIPMRKQLKEDIVLSVARTMGYTRKDLEEYIQTGKMPD